MSWYPEPFFALNETGHEKTTGTFRSSNCLRAADAGTFTDDMCSACSNIPKLESFRKRILETNKRDTTSILNEYLTSKEMVEKLKEQKEKLDHKNDQLFFATSTAIRLRIRAGRTVSRNLHFEKNGKRYRPSFKLFLEVLLMLGGPRIATFVAINLGGPEIHSIYRWRNQHRVDISGGIQESNLKKLGPLYKEAVANITSSSVPVLAAEDETAIIGHVTYHQDRDDLLGFCGVNGQHHACLDHFAVKVGDGE